MLYKYFSKIYDKKDIFLPSNYNDKYNLVNKEDQEFITSKKFKILLCHCSFNNELTRSFSFDCFSITCVRNPLDRILSHYYYFDYPKEKKLFHELDKTKIKLIIEQNGKTILTRLSGEEMDLNIAYSNIERINCILIFENINNDIVHMKNLLNKKFNKKIVLKNNFIKHNKNNFDYEKYIKKDMKIINKNLDLIKDLEVYNYIIKMSIEKRFKL
jgi:hypothetical protein